MSPTALVTEVSHVVDIAARIRAAGVFAFDLEFLSADRYIPELCLVQLAWPGDEPVAIDPLAVDVGPVLALIADGDILTIAHSARQDLQLLFERHGVRAKRFVDTQVAAAFCGLGDQIGLARLVEALEDVRLDKGSQFTDWSRRPLSARQLAYALDDVRYLLPMWDQLRARLGEAKRLSWVEEESRALAAECARPSDPEGMYRSVAGAGAVRGKALGALRALAAWRERTARAENKPPSWLIPDAAMVEVCKRGAKSAAELRRARGVGPGTVRQYGDDILEALARGRREPPPPSTARDALSPEAQLMLSVLSAAVQGECRRQDLAPRYVGARAELEQLVRWHDAGGDEAAAANLPLLSTWRREVVGDAAVAFMNGERAVIGDPDVGVRFVPSASA